MFCASDKASLVLNIDACADHKREQYILLLVIFGVLALPAAGITSLTLTNFNALTALYITINIIGTAATAWQNIFVPYTMQKAAPIQVLSAQARQEALDKVSGNEAELLRRKRELEGVRISVWGNNALYLGTTIFFAITIGLSYINASTQINAGLYVTTAAGAVCVACAVGGWRFLPVPATKSLDHGQSFLMLPFKTCEFASLVAIPIILPQADACPQSSTCGRVSRVTRKHSSSSSHTPSTQTRP